jgi:hypothetical protein
MSGAVTLLGFCLSPLGLFCWMYLQWGGTGIANVNYSDVLDERLKSTFRLSHRGSLSIWFLAHNNAWLRSAGQLSLMNEHEDQWGRLRKQRGMYLSTVVYFTQMRSMPLTFKVFWPDVISNEDLWSFDQEKPLTLQVILRKWEWFGHSLRKDSFAMVK